MAKATNSTRAPAAHTPAPATLTEIQRAWRALPRARAAQARTLQLFMDADERRASGAPELPDALLIHPADRTDAVLQEAECRFVGIGADGPIRRHYWNGPMLRLALADRNPKFQNLHAPPAAKMAVAVASRLARLKQQLKAARAYERTLRSWYAACGYTAAAEAHDNACADVLRLERTIMETPAATRNDITIKAELVGWWMKQPDWELYLAARHYARLLARSVRRDLPRIMAQG